MHESMQSALFRASINCQAVTVAIKVLLIKRLSYVNEAERSSVKMQNFDIGFVQECGTR